MFWEDQINIKVGILIAKPAPPWLNRKNSFVTVEPIKAELHFDFLKCSKWSFEKLQTMFIANSKGCFSKILSLFHQDE